MTVYQTIKEEKIISVSVMDILLGDTNEQNRKRLLLSNNLALLSKKVCMLYTSLIQIYVVARAIDSSGEYLNQIQRHAINTIKQYWNVESNQDISEQNSVFSFLGVWANAGIEDVLPKKATQAVKDIITACEKLNGNNRYEDPFIEEKFLALIRSMPLLSSFEFDHERHRIIFNNGKLSFETEYSPFVEFWNSERKCTTKNKTDYPMVLTSVVKGHKNEELYFNYVYLDKYYKNTNSQTIKKPVMEDEWLRMICQCLDVKTEWYPVEQCWGNNSFLKHINDVTYNVFVNRWGCAAREKDSQKEVQNKLKEAFYGSSMYGEVGNGIIHQNELSNYLYGLFIKFGVFKTIKSILIESKSNKDKKAFYEDFIAHIARQGLASQEQIESDKNECECTIKFHEKKLKKFLTSASPAYEKRLREIEAEWQAFTILKLSGMCTEKLFADIENIYSIDDYFEMIKNPSTSLYEDLEEVMLLLTVFYGALEDDYMSVEGNWQYDELRFQKRVIARKEKLTGIGLEALFNEFVNIVSRTEKTPLISDTLGRKYICTPEKLIEYRDEIFNDLKKADVEKRDVEYHASKWAFISYKHNDDGSTPDYIERIKKSYVNCQLDENELQGGENWKDWVYNSIHNELCEVVYVFLDKKAACSEAVKYEIMEAVEEAERRKRKDPNFNVDRFIVPVNLEKEDIATYLSELADKDPQGYARAIYRFLTPKTGRLSEKMFLKWPEDADKIFRDLLKRAPEADETGYVVKKNYSDNERHIANFYAFLKYGNDYYDIDDDDELNDYFTNPATSLCIFPMVLSVKERKIKRDNITLVGYEIISGSNPDPSENCYILTSKKLTTDEYYCIPNTRTANDCSWMIEPFLVREDLFSGKE